MCFKNLPIEFDEKGVAHLREGVRDPYALRSAEPKQYVRPTEGTGTRPGSPPRLRDWNIDPVTRVAGALAVHTTLDLSERKVVEAHSQAMLFRGYEVILKDRDPRDAIDISSRACGVCGGVHSTVSAMAIEQAFGVCPPPLGVLVRDLGEVGEMFYDHPLHLGLLAGPDYSTAIVSATNPELVTRAEATPAPHAQVHGYRSVKDIMDALNPLTGKIYLQSLEFTRVGRVMCMLMYGKYPHPSTLVPGGVSTTISTSSFNEYYTQLGKIFDYCKVMAATWDDLCDFFLEANPAYEQVGARATNLVQTGIWDDPEAYDATYENCNYWGEKRWAKPGVIIDGELRTTRLTDINMGIEEFVEHSYYADWHQDGQPARFATDPLGNPISPYHSWNKTTLPRPTGKNFKEKYTWDCTPRWDRQVMETGTYGRMWTTALARNTASNPFLDSTGDGLRITLPRHELPETELYWRVPRTLNALERNRGRAYAMAFTASIGMNCLLKSFEYWRRGETAVSTSFTVPKGERVSAGFWEAGRGYLTHHLHLDGGRIVNYQINTPSTWNASPRDPFGEPGPYEQAIIDTPILESVPDKEVKGIDVLRTIRSFDPCMPCTTHMDTGWGTIVREVNSCGCTLE